MNNINFLAIGDMVTDAFIRLKEATILDKGGHDPKLCMSFANKIPYESVVEIGAVGNSPNASVAAARLGLSSALVSFQGDDLIGKKCLDALKKKGVNTSYVTSEKGKKSNYHYVLWYEDDRTILLKHEDYSYRLLKLPKARMIYLSSIGSFGEGYHDEIADYLEANPDIVVMWQPGGFQIRMGSKRLERIYRRANIFVCNLEEAQKILNTKEEDLKKLLQGIHNLGPKMVSITDGPKGAYASDGKNAWYMPIYPDPKPPLERTGCGDSYTATFGIALLEGKSLEEALLWAPINPMSVVQYVGSQEGLLSRDSLLKLLADAPKDYKPRKI